MPSWVPSECQHNEFFQEDFFKCLNISQITTEKACFILSYFLVILPRLFFSKRFSELKCLRKLIFFCSFLLSLFSLLVSLSRLSFYKKKFRETPGRRKKNWEIACQNVPVSLWSYQICYFIKSSAKFKLYWALKFFLKYPHVCQSYLLQ